MKKILCVLLALAMLCMSVSAFAAPASVTSSVTSSVAASVTSGVEVDGLIISNDDMDDEFYLAVYDSMLEAITDGATSMELFPEEVAEAVAAVLPEGVTTDDLAINMLLPLDVADYTAEMGDVTVTYTFQPAFNPDQVVVAIVGVAGEETEEGVAIDWTVLETSVNEDGTVTVVYTAEVLEAVQNSDAVLAFLNN